MGPKLSYDYRLAGAYLVTAGGVSILLAILAVGVSVWIGYLLFDFANHWIAHRSESLKATEGMACDVELLEEGVRQVTRDGESLHRWAALLSAFEKDGAIYIVTPGSAVFIPARAFATPDDRRAAVDWILAHLSPEARARSRL